MNFYMDTMKNMYIYSNLSEWDLDLEWTSDEKVRMQSGSEAGMITRSFHNLF